ncbi:protein phosphatase CheZ [Gallaecimonas pentaromativorans]|uniref:protein phosphatase CheZ n=1 Tax=Gallaecimonas pentaromativorans TaxID=584787 RepID=UPI00067E7AE8|nr:protein phosphatase CheZ [Gallaecimonas pentaromativorans]MED5526670.1 protein phosphatase CheZ [Pseudomonadota bacterium]
MTERQKTGISLEQARALVAHLEAGQEQQAEAVLREMAVSANTELFSQVGKLTRELHDSLLEFQQDPRLATLATQDIPDAKDRLMHVITMTESAANTTMDAVESCLPIADKLVDSIDSLNPAWQRLMEREMKVGEFKTLVHDLDGFLVNSKNEADELRGALTEVLMAQGFQDLTGQIIRRVIELVREVEERLVSLVAMFGEPKMANERQKSSTEPEGPILNPEGRDDVVTGQDDVDDLLSSLGF